MWCSVLTSDICSRYRRELQRDAHPIVLKLLGALRRGTEPELFAVTSLGRLRFTTARSYQDVREHAEVWVSPHGDGVVVSHVPAGHDTAVKEVECADVDSVLHLISSALDVRIAEDLGDKTI